MAIRSSLVLAHPALSDRQTSPASRTTSAPRPYGSEPPPPPQPSRSECRIPISKRFAIDHQIMLDYRCRRKTVSHDDQAIDERTDCPSKAGKNTVAASSRHEACLQDRRKLDRSHA